MQLRCECGSELNNPPYLDKNYFIECPDCHRWLYFDSQSQNIEVREKLMPNVHPTVFFSHSFIDADKRINDFFRILLYFHYINVYEIERDTRPIDKTQKAREGIENSDFVFIVMPRRYQCYDEESRNNLWKSSEWIQNEIGMAYAYERDIIAVVEEGVKDEGMLKDIRWCYPFNRDRLWIPWIEDNNMRIPEEVKDELLNLLYEISQLREDTGYIIKP